MAALIKRYANDAWPNGRSPRRCSPSKEKGDTLAAKEPLHRAMGYNPYVTDFLLGRSALPDVIPEQITMGEEDEAQSYADQFLLVWQKVNGALPWLEAQEITAADERRCREIESE